MNPVSCCYFEKSAPREAMHELKLYYLAAPQFKFECELSCANISPLKLNVACCINLAEFVGIFSIVYSKMIPQSTCIKPIQGPQNIYVARIYTFYVSCFIKGQQCGRLLSFMLSD